MHVCTLCYVFARVLGPGGAASLDKSQSVTDAVSLRCFNVVEGSIAVAHLPLSTRSVFLPFLLSVLALVHNFRLALSPC